MVPVSKNRNQRIKIKNSTTTAYGDKKCSLFCISVHFHRYHARIDTRVVLKNLRILSNLSITLQYTSHQTNKKQNPGQ